MLKDVKTSKLPSEVLALTKDRVSHPDRTQVASL